MTPPPVFVISLARAKERRAEMIRRLDALNIRYEITDAVDGRELDLSRIADRLNPNEVLRTMGRPFLPGEIGCYLSHYQMWERIATADISCALVLEDDVEFASDFFRTVNDVVSSEWEWGIVNLATAQPSKICRVLQKVGDGRKFGLSPRSRNTCAAYLIRPSAAKKLLSFGWKMRQTVDGMYCRWWRHGATYYYVSPPPARQTGSESTIGADVPIPGGDAFSRIVFPWLFRKRERWARFWAVKRHRPQKRTDGASDAL